MILATIILSVSIVGCSSSSKKYDSDINKVVDYINKVVDYINKGVDESKQVKRKNINIKVYDDVNVNAGAVQGKKTLYAVQENSKDNYHFYFIKDTGGKVDEFGTGWDKRISEIVSKPVYEEINIK